MKDVYYQIFQLIIGSGIIVALYNNYSQIKLQNKIKLTQINENKFRSVLIFMDIYLSPNHFNFTTEKDNPELNGIDVSSDEKIKQYYFDKIKVNKANIELYASDKLIRKIDEFLINPTQEQFSIVAKIMRKELWR